MIVELNKSDVTNAFVLLSELDPAHYTNPEQKNLLMRAQVAKESALAGETVNIELVVD